MNRLAADGAKHEEWRKIYFEKIKPCELRLITPELNKLRVSLQTTDVPPKPEQSREPVKPKTL